MFSKELVAFAAGISSAAAVYQGFNYGSGLDYNTEFATAKGLAGTNGAFASARLYTTIQEGSVNTPSAAIQAAIDNDVTLLLGVWGSAGQTNVDNEIAAIKSAITTYGTAFTSRVAGISVGSEDLYRISPTGIINKSGVGAEPADLVNYISQVRAAIAGTPLSGAPVGHVDTWTAWVNGSNDAVIAACDFLGMDAYPYFQNTQANSIDNAYDLFFSAYDQTVAASEGKTVWVTETGWPASGPTEGQAVPSIANAKTYWDQVACKLLGNTNTWWYTLNDAGAAPSFGVTTGGETPLYDLTCSASSSSSSSTVASSTSSSAVVASSTVAASTTATSLSSVISSASSAAASASSALSSASSVVSAASSAASASAASSASTASLASSSVTSAASSASSAQSLVSVTATAIATQGGGGSPADESSAAADSSAAAASSTNPASYSSAAAAASSAASGALTVSTATIIPSSASGVATSAPTAGSSSIVSIVSTGTTARSTTATASLPAYTGAASTVKSTGGLIAVLFAALAAL